MSDLRERILECAVDLYLDRGMQGLSMRQVGERLGVSATAIYRHYRNKEDLLQNVIGEALKSFGSYLFTSLSGRTPEERLHLACRAYLDFAMEKGKYYEVIFLAPSQLGGTDGKSGKNGIGEPRENGDATFQFLVDRVQECMESGYLRKDDPHSVAMTIWSQSHGLVSIYLTGKCPMDQTGIRKLYAESQARLLNGLGSQTGHSSFPPG